MARAVKRPYDNSRRQAQARATRLRILEAARALFIENGYPATTLDAIAHAADTSPPTLYRLFSSKQALFKEVLDVTFGGDDQPIGFGDRPDVKAARSESDPLALIHAFARIGREFMERSSPIMHALATAAHVDPDAAQLQEDIKAQRHAGQSRIVQALSTLNALDPGLTTSEAIDMTYALMSPDVHRTLTVDRGWTADQYEHWLARSLQLLLRPDRTRRDG
ncbi:MAG TPA: helix-turn-helix domain-containing protein [Mycobacteriales bacterium]|jgi:AcrR family transcriptional regulator|nr:helix-turn-helix domain-containing protein [Mycobacteriales bacterium]